MAQCHFTQPRQWNTRRRSQRLGLSIPLIAYGASRYGPSFQEATRTLVVNAHGALISLATKVLLKQRLMLRHALSGEEQECRIIYRGKKVTGAAEVEIEFLRPAPKFWHIACPPVDWSENRTPVV
jgi:hypothetical protein